MNSDNYLPVEPNPPSPRLLSDNSDSFSTIVTNIGHNVG